MSLRDSHSASGKTDSGGFPRPNGVRREESQSRSDMSYGGRSLRVMEKIGSDAQDILPNSPHSLPPVLGEAMPTLICPHCQTPQAVSDEIVQKNLGKKCRCRQCQKTFTIEAPVPPPAAEPEGFGDFDFLNDDSPAPAPAAPPPAPAKPKAAAKPAAPAPVQPAATAPLAADEPDFSSLMGGQESPPVADFPDLSSPEPAFAPIAEASEFPSFDDVAPAPPAAKAAAPKPKAPLTRLPQPAEEDDDSDSVPDVARLPDRPALKLIASVLRIIGWVHFVFVGLAVLVGGFGVINSPSPVQMVTALASVMVMILALSASALFWFAYAELILLGLGLEARLHEISRRTLPRS